MSDNRLNLFCLVDGESTSSAFPIKVSPDDSIGDLKKLIKAEIPDTFNGVDAKDLTLWRVSLPITDDDDEIPILLNYVTSDKKKLGPATRLSKVFPEKLAEEAVHIIAQRPSQSRSDDLHPEVAALRKQLSDMKQLQEELLDPSISLSVIVKPEKKVAFTWSTFVDRTTMDDFKSYIFEYYPQYAHDEYLEIFVYNGHPKPERIRNDEDLRKILKITKTTSKTKLVISLETPTKNFSAWTFRDVCAEYNLSPTTDPGLNVIPPFADIEAAPLDSDFEKKMQNQLIDEVETFVDVLSLLGANEATKSMIVGAFLAKATRLFKEDLYLAAQRDLSGRRGNGPLDFSVHSRKTYEYTLGVTEVKKDDFKQGVAQNIVQLEAALTEKKRKRNPSDIDGEEEQPMKTRSYGIVTDAVKWLLVESKGRVDLYHLPEQR
ncbi:hypothetical protein BGZ81_005785 [Podila clonocystis]|nr:hypothetical protein BGZ81_005785 [Podila clonocystis]